MRWKPHLRFGGRAEETGRPKGPHRAGPTAGREVTFLGHLDVAKDDRGIPIEPILTMTGGGGGWHGWQFSAWGFHFRPTDLLRCTWHSPPWMPESKVVLDGGLVRSAAERARVIWS
jgi:hypothetical protein